MKESENFMLNLKGEVVNELSDVQLSEISGGGSGYCKPVMVGANGYACRYNNGRWDYKVTKGIFQATTDVIVKGWAEYGPWIPRH